MNKVNKHGEIAVKITDSTKYEELSGHSKKMNLRHIVRGPDGKISFQVGTEQPAQQKSDGRKIISDKAKSVAKLFSKSTPVSPVNSPPTSPRMRPIKPKTTEWFPKPGDIKPIHEKRSNQTIDMIGEVLGIKTERSPPNPFKLDSTSSELENRPSSPLKIINKPEEIKPSHVITSVSTPVISNMVNVYGCEDPDDTTIESNSPMMSNDSTATSVYGCDDPHIDQPTTSVKFTDEVKILKEVKFKLEKAKVDDMIPITSQREFTTFDKMENIKIIDSSYVVSPDDDIVVVNTHKNCLITLPPATNRFVLGLPTKTKGIKIFSTCATNLGIKIETQGDDEFFTRSKRYDFPKGTNKTFYPIANVWYVG